MRIFFPILFCSVAALTIWTLGTIFDTVAAYPATTASPCAHALTWQQAARKTGSTVSVSGRITSAHFAHWKNGKGSMTFLDMGARYPSPHRFSIVVWNRNVANLGGKLVCARGLVTVYKGVPEMSVDTPSALTVR